MELYARLMRQGIAPAQIDQTELEDFFAILGGTGTASQAVPSGISFIDTIMGQ